jgi:type IV pilus assembly protein PilQ
MRQAKAYSLFALLLCSLLVAFWGCATAKAGSKESLKPQEIAVVTGIDIRDNVVTITVNKPFIYTIYKPGDPYKMVVDLPDVAVGAFNKKIVSKRTGITEIVPSQIESPSRMARLEMLLQTPSLVEQEYKNNVLNIKIKEDPAEKKYPPKEIRVANPLREEKELSTGKANPNPDPPVRTKLTKATEISNISFDTSADAVKVIIKGNGSMIPNVFPLDSRIVIDIADVVLKAPIPSGVISPLRGIRSGKHDGTVRLVLDLKEKTNFDVAAIRDSVVVTLKRSAREPEFPVAQISGEKAGDAESQTETKEQEVPAGSKCEAYLQGKENVNFDFQDQDIVPIIRLFADISGCNLFIHPDVKGKATMKFRDVPWNQALDTILKTFSLDKSVEGNIVRIAPNTIFARESEEKAKAKEALVKAEPMETKIYPISYADVAIVETAVRNSKILTSRGSLSVDKRTSSMLVKDVAPVFPEVENLLATLDRPTPQVLIEGRIVEVNTANLFDLGIQWGLNVNPTNTLSSIGGLSGIPFLSTAPFSGKNYLVDFPAKNVAPLSGSGFTFGMISPDGSVALDLQLSAIETTGKLKVISNPKILTVDNGKAKILQGKSIPVRKLTSEGTISTEFKDVTLELNVIPHITPDKSVAMAIEIKKEELDPTVPSIDGVPGTDKKEANTNVIIKDGETVVIGGMYKITSDESDSGVPGLMKIPLLGWLFKSRRDTSQTLELLIFITPRIVEKP